ncbi:hypothetical protein BCR44DRAFT_270488 [Catenaria anguillulae PL171]|uniref:Uncharacterized protein n=1 Tax=Catenaria anguillulae PL171 TaxID=765915 RepID=A0A1Y2I002_9FUNG|nr:hypothetical protein BCR44DRAFT_270488 [Catenaria anguillulae PL171]
MAEARVEFGKNGRQLFVCLAPDVLMTQLTAYRKPASLEAATDLHKVLVILADKGDFFTASAPFASYVDKYSSRAAVVTEDKTKYTPRAQVAQRRDAILANSRASRRRQTTEESSDADHVGQVRASVAMAEPGPEAAAVEEETQVVVTVGVEEGCRPHIRQRSLTPPVPDSSFVASVSFLCITSSIL